MADLKPALDPVVPLEEPLSTILVVEDEALTRTKIKKILVKNRYRVLEATSGEEGLTLFKDHNVGLVILDILLPGMNGFTACEQIRTLNPGASIIMLTTLSDKKDMVKGLNLGSDDYMVKPFHPEELLARVEAVLRRAKEVVIEAPQVQFRNVTLEFHSQKCFKNGKDLDLTPTEFHLLAELLSTPGKPVSRSTLSTHIWGAHHFGSEKSLDVYIGRLRQKVEDDPTNPTLIRTKRGFGYVCE